MPTLTLKAFFDREMNADRTTKSAELLGRVPDPVLAELWEVKRQINQEAGCRIDELARMAHEAALRIQQQWSSEACKRKNNMPRYQWTRLNKQQVGAYAEYFVKMELTMYGFQVYETEVDDRGIDFITRFEDGPFIEVQVKSLRSLGYVFAQKEKFALRENLFMALALFSEGSPPDLYLIPAYAWQTPNQLFVSRDYEGLKSKAEWGLNLSQKNLAYLEQYRFDEVISHLCQ